MHVFTVIYCHNCLVEMGPFLSVWLYQWSFIDWAKSSWIAEIRPNRKWWKANGNVAFSFRENTYFYIPFFWHNGICFLVIIEQDDKVAENNSQKIRRTRYFQTWLYSVVTGNIRQNKSPNMSCFGTLKMASAVLCFRHRLDNVLIIEPKVHWHMKKKSLAAVLSTTGSIWVAGGCMGEGHKLPWAGNR